MLHDWQLRFIVLKDWRVKTGRLWGICLNEYDKLRPKLVPAQRLPENLATQIHKCTNDKYTNTRRQIHIIQYNEYDLHGPKLVPAASYLKSWPDNLL